MTDTCDMCKGEKKFLGRNCAFCNGTGEWNQTAQSYMKNHICQCMILDRKFCPVCNKKCHHDTSLNPKQTIDPGYGGTSTQISYKENSSRNEEELTIV